jgi:nicotinamidase/pyrazinamidase
VRTLLLIDVQNDFMPFGSLPVAQGDEVVPVANAVAPRFDLVVATQDWHPAGHASFASSHPNKVPGDVIEVSGLAQVLWADHCVQHSPGASFHSDLDVANVDHVVRKGSDLRIDSYSAFFDNNRVKDTGLAAYLREAGADDVWVMGLATDYCVRFSVMDALREGFRVVLLADGCRAVGLSPDDGDRAVADMQEAGCRIAFSGEVLG